MQEDIQVENIFLWLKIIPFVIICTLNSEQVQAATGMLLSLLHCTLQWFSSLAGMELTGCSNKNEPESLGASS